MVSIWLTPPRQHLPEAPFVLQFLRRQRILCCSSMFILITLECVFSALVETFIWLLGWLGGWSLRLGEDT